MTGPNARGEQDRTLIYTMTTALAAAFNILIILVVCFVVMPKMDRLIDETEKNRDAIKENRDMLESNWRELEHHRGVIRRLSDALDAAAAKQKALTEKKKAG